jgi:hypothetical protein
MAKWSTRGDKLMNTPEKRNEAMSNIMSKSWIENYLVEYAQEENCTSKLFTNLLKTKFYCIELIVLRLYRSIFKVS